MSLPNTGHRIPIQGEGKMDMTERPLSEEELMINSHADQWRGRHASVAHFEPLFGYAHLPRHLAQISEPFSKNATLMLSLLQDGPELTACLRKLVEAKDCAVRQAVIDRG